jgi:hypothetical protein
MPRRAPASPTVRASQSPAMSDEVSSKEVATGLPAERPGLSSVGGRHDAERWWPRCPRASCLGL